MAQVDMGGFAEYAIAQVRWRPAAARFHERSGRRGFPTGLQTSYFALTHRGQLQKGETVLIHSAAGGRGAGGGANLRAPSAAGKIIGTAGADEKLKLIRDNGADIALNYQTEDFVEVVKRETQGRGADVIFDPVGGEVGERDVKCVAFEGRIVLIGFTSGKFSTSPPITS